MNIIINLLHFFKLFLKTINILFVFLFLQNSYSQSEYNKVLDIQSKINEKNKGIINFSWRYSQHNSAYFDTSYNYNHNYYDSKNNKLYASNINKLFSNVIDNLGMQELSKLKDNKKSLKKLEKEIDELKSNIYFFIKNQISLIFIYKISLIDLISECI